VATYGGSILEWVWLLTRAADLRVWPFDVGRSRADVS